MSECQCKEGSLSGVLLGWGVSTCGHFAQPGRHQLLPNQHGKGVPTIQAERHKRGRKQEDLNTSKAWAGFWRDEDTGVRAALHSLGMDLSFPSHCQFICFLSVFGMQQPRSHSAEVPSSCRALQRITKTTSFPPCWDPVRPQHLLQHALDFQLQKGSVNTIFCLTLSLSFTQSHPRGLNWVRGRVPGW